MASDNPFLQEVIAHPDSDEARLIYADYLEERDDPRGEFIRVQCELASCSVLSPFYEDLRVRSQELLTEYGEEWAQELGQDVVKAEFHRGFISTVTMLGRKIPSQGSQLFSTAPIRWVRMNRVGGASEKIAAAPCLTQIRRLDVSGLKIPTEDASRLLQSQYLNSLVGLNLDYLRTDWGGDLGAALAHLSSAETLESLSMRCTEPMQAEFLPQLCSGDGFPNLHSLCFGADSGSRANWSGIRNLSVGQLDSLRITGSINTEMCESVAQLPIHQLRMLSLANTQAPASAMQALAAAGGMDEVEELDLTNCPMGLRAIKVLFTEQRLSQCKVLSLGHADANRRTTPILPMLNGIRSHHLPALLRLSLRGWGVGQLQALIDEMDTRGEAQLPLQSLALMGAELVKDDVATLAHGKWTSVLRGLDLRNANFDEESLNWLEAEQPTFPELLRLDLSAGHYLGFAVGITPIMYDARLAPWLSCQFPSLQFLRMNWAGAGKMTLERLASSELPELRVIELLESKLPVRPMKKLLAAPGLPNLRQLFVTERLNRPLVKAGLDDRVQFI